MLWPFYEQAGRSISRQLSFRRLLFVLMIGLAVMCLVPIRFGRPNLVIALGLTLLFGGIISGGLLIGWRLTQLPKSRSLEPLLLAPVDSIHLMLGEQIVAVTYFGLIMLSSVPILVLCVSMQWMQPLDALVLFVIAFTWGSFAGLGLTWWTYEPERLRKWVEQIFGITMLVYVSTAVMFFERFLAWARGLPSGWGRWIHEVLLFIHTFNPFDLIFRIGWGMSSDIWFRFWALEGVALVGLTFFVLRSAYRLKNHYLDQNYRPRVERTRKGDLKIQDWPLRVWAILRVSQYSGRANVWLAWGIAVSYSAYMLMGTSWPAWMGKRIFISFDRVGGVPAVSTVFALLAAVPAAYQYGLWDNSIPERCRRLETFLMTKLTAWDYFDASVRAAWHRGQGYFFPATLLWIAYWYAGRLPTLALLCTLYCSVAIIISYMALGFSQFTRTSGNNAIGFVLTFLLPVVTWGVGEAGLKYVAAALPGGAIFFASSGKASGLELLYFAGVWSIWLSVSGFIHYRTIRSFDHDLRDWYDRNHAKHK